MEVSDSLDVTRPTRGKRLTQRLSRRLFWLPTLFTVGNLFCGYLSIWRSIQGAFEAAAILIIAAAVLDALDGRVARWTHSTSEFGEEYDSLADLVSFGVAPRCSPILGTVRLSQARVRGLFSSRLRLDAARAIQHQTKVADKKYFVGSRSRQPPEQSRPRPLRPGAVVEQYGWRACSS
jgi:CDP-diacylglycerol--serine O-phosphatidyltransferase